MSKVIHERALVAALTLLDLHDQQIATLQKLVRAAKMRRAHVAEMVRANMSGDKRALVALRDELNAPTVNGKRYYEPTHGIEDAPSMVTMAWVRKAREHVSTTQGEDHGIETT